MHHGIGGVTPGIPYPSLGYATPLVTSGGNHWRNVETCSFEDLPLPPEQHLVVATYGFQAGGMHSTAMLSCFHEHFINTRYVTFLITVNY